MKWLLLIFLLAGVQVDAQSSRWIIQFTDKQHSPYSVQNPAAYLSRKAIARRVLQHISIDSTDLPVNPDYIKQVLSFSNVIYLNQSKWLNQLLISCKDDAVITAIKQLPFVKHIRAIESLKIPTNKVERKDEILHQENNSSLVNTTTGDTIMYGINYNQVQIHHGAFLHNKGFTGTGITIAVLDGGFYHYRELPAFDSMRLQNRMLGEVDFVDHDGSVDEDNVHGMYCLSTMAANSPGMMVGTAPGASYWLLRTENTFSEYPVEELNWAAGAAFADSAGADMISSSLGYYIFDDPVFNHNYSNFYNNSTTVSMAASLAAKKGLIVTNSAGNEGNSPWKYILFPADADSVCAAGAVDNSGNIASFSSYGYPGKIKPNIVSVGEGTVVMGTEGLPVTGNGTSFANPNINGLIACLWQAFPAYNNMTILNAVYQSADRYNNPDNRYGFGIPDMQQAYFILKKQQNAELYGVDWLFADPNPFTNMIHVKLVAPVSGLITLSLVDKDAHTIATIHLTTEEQEVYDTTFTMLDNLVAGQYTIQYSDGQTTKSLMLEKKDIMKDWLVAAPVPFNNQLTIYIKAPETGSISVRLMDAAGRIIESATLTVTLNNNYTVPLKLPPFLAAGVYFIQYSGRQKKTLKVVK